MSRTTLAIILLTSLLGACGDEVVAPGPIAVEGPGYRGVILPASAWPSYGFEVEGFWTVTLKDIRKAEARIEFAARKFAPELQVPLERYVRQYVGIVHDGEHKLYVNLLHEDAVRPTQDDEPGDVDRWRRELSVVDDGGDRYVEAFFDPESGRFTDVWVHGEA